MLHQIRHTLPVEFSGSDSLYNAARAALVARGSSLNAWCKANGINRQTAEKALRGIRHGRRSLDLRRQIVTELFPDGAA
jgi:hypothetical protein